ncbi:MAG TPA: hypothetical protein VLE20_12225 [Blastocatellia bacterium]|nr:hypothetical protein [Blastocatellia bacterium]
MSSDRLQKWLLRLGLVVSAVLLIRFAIGFTKEITWWLAAPFWLLVVGALGAGVRNVVSARSEPISSQGPLRDPKRALLVASIPLGFLASSLDCMGLSLEGCSPFCTFVKLVWIPLIAGLCAVYCFTGKQVWLTAIAGMSFLPLFPHCVCYNVGNWWWIDRIGASPVCYAWGFAVSVIAVGALRPGVRSLPSLAVCYAVITGATAFFVAHHYLRFPW